MRIQGKRGTHTPAKFTGHVTLDPVDINSIEELRQILSIHFRGEPDRICFSSALRWAIKEWVTPQVDKIKSDAAKKREMKAAAEKGGFDETENEDEKETCEETPGAYSG